MKKYIILSVIIATSSVYANNLSLEGESSLVANNAVDKCLDLLESKEELSSRYWRYSAVRVLNLLVHEENVPIQVQVDRVNRLKNALAKAFKSPDNDVGSYVDLATFEKDLLAYESELLKLQQEDASAGAVGNETIVVTADDVDETKNADKIKTCVNGIRICIQRIEAARPDNGDLSYLCLAVLSALQELQKTTMPLVEQFYLCKSAIHCISAKIKSIIAEHPTQVVQIGRLWAVDQKLIAHAQDLLKHIPADDKQQ